MARDDCLLSSAVEAIGNTPLVELTRLMKGFDGRILAKLDYLNPGFSKKDRIARQIIEDAEREGTLKPGQVVVELTSGNTGTGLAIVCAIKGYHFVAVMSRGNSIERARMMEALGAEVVLVNQLPESVLGKVSGGDLALVEERAQELTRRYNAFRADQFRNQSNYLAHYLHTGPEILKQSGGSIDLFCDYVGTGATFAGCATAFKEANPEIKCYVVEPEDCAILAGKPIRNPDHQIQGGGYSISDLDLLDRNLVDGYIQVSDDDAILACRQLAKTEGIFAGFSSGANIAAGMKLLEGEQKGKTVVVMMCDSGLKYLSTSLWG